MSPSWAMVLIAGLGAVGSILVQYIMSSRLEGRYMERVDNLVAKVNDNKSVADREISKINEKVETLVQGMGQFKSEVFMMLRSAKR